MEDKEKGFLPIPIVGQLVNRAWKISVLSIAISITVTIFIVSFTGNMEQLRTAVAIAIICSGPASYLIARLILRYQKIIEQQNHELLAINQLLEESNIDLESYAHTVAHDLKGPLSNILGFATILQRQLDDTGTASPQLAQQIEKTIRKMDNIIHELLLLSQVRKQQVETHLVNMGDIVTRVEKRLAPMITEYDGEIHYPEEWPPAYGYGPWIEEVWVNYLSNGLKYGGSPPRLELGSTTHGDQFVRYWVRDNGRGLSPGEQSRLFNEFIRLEQTRAKGHGLGLSIVRRIVEQLGGEVGIESQPGEGSLFYFTLPRESYVPQHQTATSNGGAAF